MRCCILPGNTPKAKELASQRNAAVLGNSLREGPTHCWSPYWMFSTYEGIVNLQFYFWLIKDWSWSQLQWFWPGMIFGSIALLHGVFLIVAALFYGAFSEAAVGIGMWIWLFANYWWMIGEFWGYVITADSPPGLIPKVFYEDNETWSDVFYDNHTEDTKWISLAALVWLSLVVFVFPFIWNDRGNVILMSINENSPRPRFQFWFRDFLEYETFHMFSWSLKDTMWAWGYGPGYILGFFLTLALTMDLIFSLWSHSGQWVELFHYFALFFWVLANGFWAIGEIFVETSEVIPDDAWDSYKFIPADANNHLFWSRNVAGWLFMCSTLILLIFYIYWLCFASVNSKLKFDDELGLDEQLDSDKEYIRAKRFHRIGVDEISDKETELTQM